MDRSRSDGHDHKPKTQKLKQLPKQPLKNPNVMSQMNVLMLECFQTLNLKLTANKFQQEAQLPRYQDYSQEIEAVKAKKQTQQEQRVEIQLKLEKWYHRYIQENNVAKALEMLQGPLKDYMSSKIEKYSSFLLLPPVNPYTPPLMSHIQNYLTLPKDSKLPSHQIISYTFEQQVIFMKSNQMHTVLIFTGETGRVIKGNMIVAERSHIHNVAISELELKSESFATAANDTSIKLWTYQLQCLRTFTENIATVKCMAFIPGYLISAGKSQYTLFNRLRKANRNPYRIHSGITHELHHSVSTKELLMVPQSKQNNVINFYPLSSLEVGSPLEVSRSFEVNAPIKNIQICSSKKMLFVHYEEEVAMVHLVQAHIIRRFNFLEGFNEISSIDSGGMDSQYLLLGHLQGVVIYNISNSQPVSRLKNKTGQEMAAAIWIESNQIMMVSSSRKLEIWSAHYQPQDVLTKKLSRP